MKLRLPGLPKKWLSLLVAFELALVSVLTCVLVDRPPVPRISTERWNRIEHGMSRDEVTAILGRPSAPSDVAGQLEFPRDYSSLQWRARDGIILVVFNPSGEVSWAFPAAALKEPAEETPVERLKKLWRRLFP